VSNYSVVLPIVAAVQATETQLGLAPKWQAVNNAQVEFLENFLPLKSYLNLFPEIKASAMVSETSPRITAPNIKTIKAYGNLDVTVEWPEEGQACNIITPAKKSYPGVRLQKNRVSFHESKDYEFPIIRIETRSSDLVYMTMLPAGGEYTNFELEKAVKHLFWDSQPRLIFGKYGGLQFPMAKFRISEKISWLMGMKGQDAEGFPAVMADALQETKLKLNRQGARVISKVWLRTDVMLARMPDPEPPDYIINQPFLVWFVRTKVAQPYAIFWLDEADWKDPGDLDSF